MTAAEIPLRLRTEDGISGWGEASPFAPGRVEIQASVPAAGTGLAPLLRGRDPFELSRVMDDLDAAASGNGNASRRYSCGGVAGFAVCRPLGQTSTRSKPTARSI